MLNILVKFIFKIIAFFGSIVMAPIVAVASAVIPDFSQFVDGILSFFTTMVSFIPFVVKLLMIPDFCINAVVLLFTSYITFKVGFATYKLILKLYQKFKP